ncbi:MULTISPECIES: hypothetical protein [unclassified Knoellia]|uniref:hypothetical protein n=1 Tax=Knoellia altitudinis TaxID=3404795 RepID=UPI003614C602
MTVGVGDDVAQEATPDATRPEQGWHARFLVAFGGAVVAVSLVLLGSLWGEGLRGSTFEDLRADIRDGLVQEWYAADRLNEGHLGFMQAEQAPLDGPIGAEGSTGTTTAPEGDPTGGILVWRTWESGWHVAAAGAGVGSWGEMSSEATPESQALVEDLREAGVSMRPFAFGGMSALEKVAVLGAALVFLGLLMGAAPRVGTRWFWFWLFVNAPLALGLIAYAVTELIGFRRRPDPPLTRRLSGWMGFLGALVLSFAVGIGGDYLRSRGVALPLWRG